MTLRTSAAVSVGVAVALAFAPSATAKDGLRAKFKVVSASGRASLSFHEESTIRGESCIGTTA